MDKEEILSRTISCLRFPLILGVVLLHIRIPLDAERGNLFSEFRFFLCSCVGDLAVPLFFLISGFLFFYKTRFTWEKYLEKLRRRFHSLMIPYFFWISAFMIMTLVIQLYLPSLNNRKLLSEYTLLDFLNSFWNYSGIGYGCPMLSYLWFLRDLILMVIFSPVVYSLIRLSRGFMIAVLFLCYFFNVHIGIMGFPKSWLFFSLGAFFAIYHVNFVDISERLFKYLISVGCLFMMVMVVLHAKHMDYPFVPALYISIMIFVVVAIFAKYVKRGGTMPSILTESSFFIYVFHGFYMNPLNVLYSSVVPINTATGILGYFILPIVACSIAICVFVLLKKAAPKFCSVVTGGR